jgi:hypothetical protein
MILIFARCFGVKLSVLTKWFSQNTKCNSEVMDLGKTLELIQSFTLIFLTFMVRFLIKNRETPIYAKGLQLEAFQPD